LRSHNLFNIYLAITLSNKKIVFFMTFLPDQYLGTVTKLLIQIGDDSVHFWQGKEGKVQLR